MNLKEYVDLAQTRGMQLQEIARILGISRTSLWKYLTKDSKPSKRVAKDMVRATLNQLTMEELGW
jgi:transcriptional regulator with XRE-family HTH domain